MLQLVEKSIREKIGGLVRRKMLTKPKYGWSDFELDGTSLYGLSYLNDIAFVWLEDAIHGLEVLRPFCVEGFMEPNRFICNVSYWNCHIICEDDEGQSLVQEEFFGENHCFF